MGLISVLVAAVAAYAFGAVWYMVLAKPWMAAVGISEEDVNRKDPKPYIVSFVCIVIVTGMMRHVMVMAELDGFSGGLMAGFGLGAFIAAPWIVTNYTFAMRPAKLILIDCGYSIGGCSVMGIVLGLF